MLENTEWFLFNEVRLWKLEILSKYYYKTIETASIMEWNTTAMDKGDKYWEAFLFSVAQSFIFLIENVLKPKIRYWVDWNWRHSQKILY